jgi:hypothetical protein
MGYVKKKIKELVKEAGSKKKARSEAEDWFKKGMNSRSLNEVQQTRDRFQPGKIYVFDYKPITKDLPWFDANPVVLAIEHKGENDLGINLNLLPINIKEDLLDELYSRMEGQINNATSGKRSEVAKTQSPLRITYDGMSAYLKSKGYDFAIRQYVPSGKSRQSVISYKKWPDIALCDFIELNGTTVAQIRRMFFS